jgi:hypothetical protein
VRLGAHDFDLTVEDAPPHSTAPDGEPATIHVDDDLVRVDHARFDATIDPFGRRVMLRCVEEDRLFATEITVRAAMSALLPLEGGVLLHSAGIVIGERGVAFFGPSGAGKSTLSSLVDAPVLSDELIAITRDGDDFFVRATGFWGEMEERPFIDHAYPLVHLVELSRGDDVAFDALSMRETARALVGVTVVPPHARLWRAALPIVNALSRVASSRLRWKPGRENAARVMARF